MNIGIFSKFEMAGGSEFRGCELANGLIRFAGHSVTLLVRGNRFPERLKEYLDPNVKVVLDAFSHPDEFYDKDAILIINSDSKEFTTTDYWDGKGPTHGKVVDLTRVKKIIYLFNFLISPSRYLNKIANRGPKVGIITTNTKFFDEVTKQDRYEEVRIYPRIRLESPIDPHTVHNTKNGSQKIRVGMHSKGLGNKWNEDIAYVISKINDRYPELPFTFRFMGINGNISKLLVPKFTNVEVLRENQESVKDFLHNLDVFMFFPSWSREEPWARVVGEAMMSGCPILATDKGGNKDQVLDKHNGFLCKRKDDFVKHLCLLKEYPNSIISMGLNSRRLAFNTFRTEKIIGRLNDFISSF